MCAFAMIVITDPNNKRAGRVQRGTMQRSRGRLSGKEGDQYVIKKIIAGCSHTLTYHQQFRDTIQQTIHVFGLWE